VRSTGEAEEADELDEVPFSLSELHSTQATFFSPEIHQAINICISCNEQDGFIDFIMFRL